MLDYGPDFWFFTIFKTIQKLCALLQEHEIETILSPQPPAGLMSITDYFGIMTGIALLGFILTLLLMFTTAYEETRA
jgi:hypothetical protein